MTERASACERNTFGTRSARMFIPPVKAELGERRLEPIRNDTLDFSFKKPVVFSGEYRKKTALFDLLAKKYASNTQGWIDRDGERFVAGPSACAMNLKNPADPQMEKAAAFLNRFTTRSLGAVYAIYLLGIDESDENRQAFLLLGESGILLRDGALDLYECLWEEAEFSEDGLVLNNADFSLDWTFDGRFLEYVKEIYALKFTWPEAVPIRHPFMDLAMKLEKGDTGAVQACIDFFIDLSAASLDLRNLLLLENFVALFRLSESGFLAKLCESASKKLSKNDLVQRLNIVLNLAGPQYRELLFLFILEFCGDSSNSRCRDMLDILRRDKFADREFVDAALRFHASQKETQTALAEILAIAPNAAKDLVAHKQYITCFDLEIINKNTGAPKNESDTGS